MNDLRFALRQLRKSPGFTSLAIITLAIGIGMNTAIFSLIQDLFLRGLPFSEPERVVRIYGEAKERDLKQMPFSVPKFWHYRDGQTVFSSIAADWGNGFIMTGSAEPIQLLGGNVTANYFELLGIHPILGRNFLPEEEKKGDVVMVTESFWRKHFNAIRNALTREVQALDPNLAPTAPFRVAEQVDRKGYTQRLAATLIAIFGAMALFLAAIGLYAVMSYSVSQSTRELGLRMALGAGVKDLLGMVMSRGVRLTAAGIVIGAVAAVMLTRLIGNLLYKVSPRDPIAFGTAFVILIVVALIACFLPAWRATRIDPVQALHEQ